MTDDPRKPRLDSMFDAVEARIDDLLSPTRDDDDPATEARDWLPERIGDYDIVRRIGAGGMGVVFEAVQESPRRRVAIKLLAPHHASPDRLRRFRQEAELLGRLRHPGIAQIYEAGSFDSGAGQHPFFAMELIEGRDLRAHCDERGLDARARLGLVAEICDAVQHAHDAGVVHRDLKPDNVLVDARGHPRVLDFGIARAAASSTVLSTIVTGDGQLVGTLGYMAPEQLDSTEDDVDARADVYALGAIAFELLTRRLPHQIAELPVSAAIHEIATRDAPRASQIEPSLAGDVDTILAKALESSADRRYGSAAALGADIRRHLEDQPIHARPPSRVYLLRKFVRRNRGLTIGAVATFATLTVGLIVALVLLGREQEQRRRADANAREVLHNQMRIVGSLNAEARRAMEQRRWHAAYASHTLVPESARGWSWHLRAQTMPRILDLPSDLIGTTPDAPPGPPAARFRFVDDDRIVGLDGARDVVFVYDIATASRRDLFGGTGIVALGPPCPTGLMIAHTSDEALLLDLDREAVVDRWPISDAPRPGSVSDDGRVVVVQAKPGLARVMVDGTLWREIDYSGERLRRLHPCCLVDPSGARLFVNTLRELRVIDIATGRTRTFEPPDGFDRIWGFGLRDGWICDATKVDDATVTATWLVRGDEWTRDPQTTRRSVGARNSLSAPRDGRFVATGCDRGLHLRDSATGEPVQMHRWQDEAGYLELDVRYWSTVEVSPSGRHVLLETLETQPWLVTLDEDWVDPHKDVRCSTYREHDKVIYDVAVSHDGCLVASASPDDPVVRVWDARTSETITTFERRGETFAARDALFAFSADDERLLMTTPMPGRDGAGVVEWHLRTGEVATHWPERPHTTGNHAPLLDDFIGRLAPGPRARLSRKAHMVGDRALSVWTTYENFGWQNAPGDARGDHWRVVPEPGRPTRLDAWALAVHPTEELVAVVSCERIAQGADFASESIALRRATDGELLASSPLPDNPWAVAWSPDARSIAVAVGDGDIAMVETEFLTVVDVFRAHDEFVKNLVWMPDSVRLVTVSGDCTARVFDCRPRAVREAELQRWRTLRTAAAASLARGESPATGDPLAAAAARVERILSR